MKLRPEWRSRILSACAALGLTVVAGDLAIFAAGTLRRPELPRQLLAPQDQACVVRADACALARTLRSLNAERFDVGTEINPEVYQRVVELAYPQRIARGAAVSVGLCRRAAGAPRPPIRVADIELPADRDADFCVVDRR